jgi:hypothetical protein
MRKFLKYLGSAHVNYMNLALYESGSVRVENVVNNHTMGIRKFESVEAAEAWFESLGEKNLDRTVAAIENLYQG